MRTPAARVSMLALASTVASAGVAATREAAAQQTRNLRIIDALPRRALCKSRGRMQGNCQTNNAGAGREPSSVTDGALEQLADPGQHLNSGIGIVELMLELWKSQQVDGLAVLLQRIDHLEA